MSTTAFNLPGGPTVFGGGGSGGAGGTPGGSDTQIQYNNAGSFGGMAGTAWNNTTRSLAITGATVTTSNPLFDLTQTWNAGAVTFTGLKFNVTDTASAAASLLLDLQVGGASKLYVAKSGTVTNINNGDGFVSSIGSVATSNVAYGYYGVRLASSSTITFGSSALGITSSDTILARDAANTLALKNAANAQEFRVYENTTGTIYKAIKGDGQLIKIAGAAFTDGAAAASGTLTNAPAAGNPTKWIPIDDNGTTRYIPAW